MKFYIVTPSFCSVKWLKATLHSVADQVVPGIEVHHHVQDGGSSDGTLELMQEWQQNTHLPGYTFTFNSHQDSGMYDALNTAWDYMPTDADVTAHLNSDEQYLPDALRMVAGLFQSHTKADIIECSYIVNDKHWNYICHRRCVRPTLWISKRVCQLCTCATFHKTSSFRLHGIRFDTRFRVYGDVLFFRHLIERGINVHAAPEVFSSAFTITGSNLAWQEKNRNELRFLNSITPPLSMKLAPIGGRITAIKRILLDILHKKPFCLSIYHGEDTARTTVPIIKPTCLWRIIS